MGWNKAKKEQPEIKFVHQQNPSAVLNGWVCVPRPFLGYYLTDTEGPLQFSFLPINSLYLLCPVAISGTCPEALRTYTKNISNPTKLLGCNRSAFCLHRSVTASLKLVCLGSDSGIPVAARSVVRAAQTCLSPGWLLASWGPCQWLWRC